MKKTTHIFLIFTITILFTACSNKSQVQIPFESASLQKTLQNKNNINSKLYSFYSNWKGVKYKYGGNSKRGIDCSALIQIAYKNSFDISLPRTTTLQSKVGKTIRKSQLKSGDLIFFKTGKKSKPVGIYIENGKFFHASTKKGVTISRLDNSYFKRHYWKSTRVLY